MDHAYYNRYPMMKPHVGARYAPGGAASLLLIGESHYLPPYSTQHVTAKRWYSMDSSTLNEQEMLHINTSLLIRNHSAEGFRSRGVSIWRLSFSEINRCGPQHADYRDVGNEIVFCNYFVRPASTSVSLVVEEQDILIADELFRIIVEAYRPNAVVFLSRLAFLSCRSRHRLTIPVVATPHPGCAHWNRVSQAYGNRRGRDVLGDLVRSLEWSNK